MTKQWLKIDYLPIPLIALMILTRFHHFGDTLHLPDASLAVFFFAGFYCAGRYGKTALLVFLLAMAGLIDYLAIANGTSDWCISPAYVFLIPTYTVMWWAGLYCSTFKALTLPKMAISISLVMLAASAAFVISNGSFFLFSGRYEDLSSMAYALSVAQYFPSYVGSVLVYALAGLVIVRIVKVLLVQQPRHHEV